MTHGSSREHRTSTDQGRSLRKQERVDNLRISDNKDHKDQLCLMLYLCGSVIVNFN